MFKVSKKKKYLFAIMRCGIYDINCAFGSTSRAIELALTGHTLAVLDPTTLQFLGCI